MRKPDFFLLNVSPLLGPNRHRLHFVKFGRLDFLSHFVFVFLLFFNSFGFLVNEISPLVHTFLSVFLPFLGVFPVDLVLGSLEDDLSLLSFLVCFVHSLEVLLFLLDDVEEFF